MAANHPLEPLSADEFRRTAALLRHDGHVSASFRFASIELKEPPKAEVKAWRQGDEIPSVVAGGGLNRADNQTYEAVADLTDDAVVRHARPRRRQTSPGTSSRSR
jgi:primary-amine oxidase